MKVIPERATTKMGSNIQWNTESTILYHLESNCGNDVCILRKLNEQERPERAKINQV